MKPLFHTRTATISDVYEIKTLFKETILSVNRRDYTTEEVEDWASCGENEGRWKALITELYFKVAINDDNQIVGFSSITKDGYLHHMFIHKNYQGLGIATLLYLEMEAYACQNHICRVTSEVSITARPFFERQGFIIDATQQRKANQLLLTNYKMSKQLKQL